MNRLFYFLLFIFCLTDSTWVSAQPLSQVHPKNGQYVSESTILSWNTLDTTNVSYELSITYDSTLNVPLIQIDLFEPTYRFKPDSSARYYWRVIAKANGVVLDSSAMAHFYFFNPKSVDSLNLWLRADSGVTLNGGKLSSWQDLSDSGVVVSQTNAALQPAFLDSSLNRLPVIDFDAIDDQLLLNVALPDNNFSISAVYNVHESSSRGIRLLDGSFNWLMGPHAGFHRGFNGGFLPGKLVIVDQYVAHSITAFKDTTKNFVNNIYFGENVALTPPGTSLTIGSNRLNGSLAELLIINGVSKDSVRQTIDNYLMDKYAPPVNLGQDRKVCSFPDSIALNIDYALDYSWSTGDTTDAVQIDSAGKYYVTITDMFERQSVDSMLYILDTTNFQVDFGFEDTTLCQGEQLSLKAGPELYTYQWNTGDSLNQIVVDSTAIYKVTVTNCLNLKSVDSVRINFSRPVFSLGEDTTICFNDSIQLKADTNSGFSFLWSDSSVDSTLTVNLADQYALTVTDSFGCNFSDSITVMVDSSLSGMSLGPDTTLCSGNVIGLKEPISGIDSYQWSNSPSTDSFLLVSSSRTYGLTVTKNSCQNSDSIFVGIKGDAPSVGFLASDLCFKDTLKLVDTTSDPNNISIKSRLWKFGDGDSSNLTQPEHLFDSVGTYQVSLEVENDSGCIGVASQSVTVSPLPEINFSVGLACENDSVSFSNASSISSGILKDYRWDFGDSTTVSDSSNQINPFYRFPYPGDFMVSLEGTSDRGCSNRLLKSIKVNPSPRASFEAKGLFVDDSTSFMDRSSISTGMISSYKWDFGNAQSSTNKNPTVYYGQTGTYLVSLEVTSDSSCQDTFVDSISIVKRPPPRPEFNTILPKNRQVVSGKVLFSWNEKDSVNRYEVEVSKDKNFSVLLASKSETSLSTSMNFNLDNVDLFWRVIAFRAAQPIDTTNVADFKFFDPKSVDSLNLWLRADSGVTLNGGKLSSWQDLSDSGVVVSQTNAALQPAFLDSSLNRLPVIDFDAINDQLLLNVALPDNNFSISAVYNVHEFSSRGIRLLDGSFNWLMGPHARFHRGFNGGFLPGKLVIVDQYVAHSITAFKDTTKNFVNNIYFGENVAQTPPGTSLTIGSNRLNGSLAELLIINGVSDDSVRQTIDTYLMDKYAPPVNLGQDRKVCSFPDSIALNIDYALDYSWSTGDTTDAVQIDSAGKYYVTITDMFERQSVDSVFFILDTSNFQVDLGFKDTTICQGEAIELIAGREIYDFQWNTGDSSHNLKIDSAGMYKVTVKNCLNQLSSDSIFLTINHPKFSLGPDTTACFNQLLQIRTDSNFQNVSYLWSNGDTTASIMPDTSGTYSLKVTDAFNCSFFDTLNFSIDSNLYKTNLGPDTSLCEGNLLSLKNAPSNINSYSWSTGSNQATIPVDTSGTYFLEFSDGFCTARDSVQITIKGLAPNADFLSSNFCFQDTVEFLNSSVIPPGDSISSVFWDFGDGNDTNILNPAHRFSAPGSFRVKLRLSTDKQCVDTISKVIQIQPKPKADFGTFTTTLCSKEPIKFLDSSTVSSGNILGYFWNFGDSLSNSNTSNSREPTHSYDTLGDYSVSLTVETSQGCKDTLVKTIFINPTPHVDFTFSGACLNDSSRFQDRSILPVGEVDDYLWVANNQISVEKNPTFKFLSSGKKPIILRLRTKAGCEAVLRDSISIFENPSADFEQLSSCVGVPLQFTNQSSGNDSLVFFRYVFNQTDTSFLANPSFEATEVGIFPLQLLVVDTNNCRDSIQKSIQVNPNPTASFSTETNQAGIPFQLGLINNSSGANEYLWDFGNGVRSTDFQPIFTYQDTGNFQLKLVVHNQDGCRDSAITQIVALPPLIDAAIDQMQLIQQASGQVGIQLRLINSGNNTIRSFRLTSDVNNQFQFTETFEQTLFRGRGNLISFSSQFLPEEGNELEFICVRIEEVNGAKDEVADNNELCKEGFEDQLFLNLFPNPALDELTFEFVLPEAAKIKLDFYDQLGRKVMNALDVFLEAGVHQKSFVVNGLRPGIYYFRFSYSGQERKGAFMKR